MKTKRAPDAKLKGRATGENLLDKVPLPNPEVETLDAGGGMLKLRRPKFKRLPGKLASKLFFKPNHLTINLDPLGSAVWGLCDGTRSVGAILKGIEEKFPGEGDLPRRLQIFLFHLEKGQIVRFA